MKFTNCWCSVADYIKWMSEDQANFYNMISNIGTELQFGHYVSLCLINKIKIKTTLVYGLLLNNTALHKLI